MDRTNSLLYWPDLCYLERGFLCKISKFFINAKDQPVAITKDNNIYTKHSSGQLLPLTERTFKERVKDVGYSSHYFALLTKSGKLFMKVSHFGFDIPFGCMATDIKRILCTNSSVTYLKLDGTVATWKLNGEIDYESIENDSYIDESEDNWDESDPWEEVVEEDEEVVEEDELMSNDSSHRSLEEEFDDCDEDQGNTLRFREIALPPVAKIVCDPESRLFLALTRDGDLFLWGKDRLHKLASPCLVEKGFTGTIKSMAIANDCFVLLTSDGLLYNCIFQVNYQRDLETSFCSINPPEPMDRVFYHAHQFVLLSSSGHCCLYKPRIKPSDSDFTMTTFTSVPDTFAYYSNKWTTPFLTTLPQSVRKVLSDTKFHLIPKNAPMLRAFVGNCREKMFTLDARLISKYGLELIKQCQTAYLREFNIPVYFSYFIYLFTRRLEVQPNCLLDLCHLAHKYYESTLFVQCVESLFELPDKFVSMLAAKNPEMILALLIDEGHVTTANACRIYEAALVCSARSIQTRMTPLIFEHFEDILHSSSYRRMHPHRFREMILEIAQFTNKDYSVQLDSTPFDDYFFEGSYEILENLD